MITPSVRGPDQLGFRLIPAQTKAGVSWTGRAHSAYRSTRPLALNSQANTWSWRSDTWNCLSYWILCSRPRPLVYASFAPSSPFHSWQLFYQIDQTCDRQIGCWLWAICQNSWCCPWCCWRTFDSHLHLLGHQHYPVFAMICLFPFAQLLGTFDWVLSVEHFSKYFLLTKFHDHLHIMSNTAFKIYTSCQVEPILFSKANYQFIHFHKVNNIIVDLNSKWRRSP